MVDFHHLIKTDGRKSLKEPDDAEFFSKDYIADPVEEGPIVHHENCEFCKGNFIFQKLLLLKRSKILFERHLLIRSSKSLNELERP